MTDVGWRGLRKSAALSTTANIVSCRQGSTGPTHSHRSSKDSRSHHNNSCFIATLQEYTAATTAIAAHLDRSIISR